MRRLTEVDVLGTGIRTAWGILSSPWTMRNYMRRRKLKNLRIKRRGLVVKARGLTNKLTALGHEGAKGKEGAPDKRGGNVSPFPDHPVFGYDYSEPGEDIMINLKRVNMMLEGVKTKLEDLGGVHLAPSESDVNSYHSARRMKAAKKRLSGLHSKLDAGRSESNRVHATGTRKS